MFSFDEHDEDDQVILWERAQVIAQDNAESALCEEEYYDELGEKDNGKTN